MSTISLNGVSSASIPGLIISSLPPISLPGIRTQIETVDGRDGDIVTPLGYSAYDKTFTVGLHGLFNIDQVIAFFASSGKVIFSNEADKFYYYTIVKQIDFTRLLRFRTANVTLHVQPFKYSVSETPIVSTGASATVTNAGNIYAKPTITITGSGTVGLYLNTVQILSVALGESEKTVFIDIDAMNAYDQNGSFVNRSVTGNYAAFLLPVGESTVSWSGGTVSAVKIENYSRWI